jgi:hypothetical protein
MAPLGGSLIQHGLDFGNASETDGFHLNCKHERALALFGTGATALTCTGLNIKPSSPPDAL